MDSLLKFSLEYFSLNTGEGDVPGVLIKTTFLSTVKELLHLMIQIIYGWEEKQQL